MMVFDIIQGISIVAFELICCKLFLEVFLEKRLLKKILKIVSMPAFIIIVYLGSWLLSGHIIVKNIFVYIATLIIIKSLFYTKFFGGCLLAAFFQSLLYGIDYLVVITFREICLPSYAVYIMIILLSKMLLFAIVILIKRKWERQIFLNLTDSEWIQFLYFPVATIIMFIIMIFYLRDIENAKIEKLVIIIALIVIGMNLLILDLLKNIVFREEELQYNKMNHERTLNQIKMYKMISGNYEKERKKTHEYKNHMSCIEGMLKENQIDRAMQYVEKITGGLRKDLDIIDTNNVMINTILNIKYQEANEKSIIFILKVSDLSNIAMKDNDLVVILTNLLDNAIEACKQVKENRKMWIKLIDEEEMTIISVKNTVAQSTDIINGKFQTTKDNKLEHGFGVENIKDIVKKYNGEYTIKSEESYFVFSIIFPH